MAEDHEPAAKAFERMKTGVTWNWCSRLSRDRKKPTGGTLSEVMQLGDARVKLKGPSWRQSAWAADVLFPSIRPGRGSYIRSENERGILMGDILGSPRQVCDGRAGSGGPNMMVASLGILVCTVPDNADCNS